MARASLCRDRKDGRQFLLQFRSEQPEFQQAATSPQFPLVPDFSKAPEFQQDRVQASFKRAKKITSALSDLYWGGVRIQEAKVAEREKGKKKGGKDVLQLHLVAAGSSACSCLHGLASQ